jgi:UDPglucose 6-dehydrogenase|tara:strand:- start:988 stop:1821 length:834 start_codon:yes stop_codon:yes gene_type:complete
MIGIIGQGFVGNAVYQKFSSFYEVFTYDLDKDKCNSSLSDVIFKCETIFVCVPTPMKKDGSCDTSIIESILGEVDLLADNIEAKRTIIIKSTIPPGTTARFNNRYESLSIVFNPEFLTERNAVADFENQDRIIIGGPRPTTTEVKTIFSKVFPKAHIIKTDSTHAEMVKYTTNTFLATKISFANEIYQLCGKLNIDYDKVIEYATLDDRLGDSHWGVPGHDGDLGFGGHCFPKDLAALLYLSRKYNTTNNVLCATQETNNNVRENRDWERMKGRAVS